MNPHCPSLKRLIDFVGASLGLVLLAPVMAVLAVLVRLSIGPVFFRQVRPGLHGRPFQLWKFRTMKETRDRQGRLLSDAERLTRLGRFLRHWSLDELPELFNVLRGQMSLIGPRPLLVEYLPRYTPEQARRHNVRPGITGLAQIMGRNAIPFSLRLAYDVYYVDHQSLRLDLRILLLTFFKVGTGRLFDGAGQDVSVVDDIGLHPGQQNIGQEASKEYRKSA
jgi:lipopolysaccharide/colanic/teichoic acid biosynthesis glycosyltransferase